MRTDSTRISDSAHNEAKQYIEENLANNMSKRRRGVKKQQVLKMPMKRSGQLLF